MERMNRYGGNVTADLHGDTFFRVTFEQSIYQDATCSAMLQRPRFYHRCCVPLMHLVSSRR